MSTLSELQDRQHRLTDEIRAKQVELRALAVEVNLCLDQEAIDRDIAVVMKRHGEAQVRQRIGAGGFDASGPVNGS